MVVCTHHMIMPPHYLLGHLLGGNEKSTMCSRFVGLNGYLLLSFPLLALQAGHKVPVSCGSFTQAVSPVTRVAAFSPQFPLRRWSLIVMGYWVWRSRGDGEVMEARCLASSKPNSHVIPGWSKQQWVTEEFSRSSGMCSYFLLPWYAVMVAHSSFLCLL